MQPFNYDTAIQAVTNELYAVDQAIQAGLQELRERR
jgi:hypothetical protein